MQTLPRFKSYKILQQYPIITDSTGNEINLTLFEVWLNSNNDEIIQTAYQFWTVCGKAQEKWQNGAISYKSEAYWQGMYRELLTTTITTTDGLHFKIEEIVSMFPHHMYGNDQPGTKTYFKIYKLD